VSIGSLKKLKHSIFSDRKLFQNCNATAGRNDPIRLPEADPGGHRHLLRIRTDPTPQYIRSLLFHFTETIEKSPHHYYYIIQIFLRRNGILFYHFLPKNSLSFTVNK
jgi:hypothetical protein